MAVNVLKSIRLEIVNKLLVSSGKMIGVKVLFIILGIHKRISRGPKIEPCGTPGLTLARFET